MFGLTAILLRLGVGVNFLNMHSWQRVPNPSYFMKTPLNEGFSNFVLPPSLLSTSSPPLPAVLFTALFFWLCGWSRHNWCVILLNDMSSLLGTLVVERPCCVFHTTRSQIYWGQTLLWFDMIHSIHRSQETDTPI